MTKVSDLLAGANGRPAVLPQWVDTVPYLAAAHPQAAGDLPIAAGANCQRFAYAVLGMFGRDVPPYRSSDLWDAQDVTRLAISQAQDLDLVLFNREPRAWGAHVAVVMDGQLIQLCAEVGTPAVWHWSDFTERERYRSVVGLVRIPA